MFKCLRLFHLLSNGSGMQQLKIESLYNNKVILLKLKIIIRNKKIFTYNFCLIIS